MDRAAKAAADRRSALGLLITRNCLDVLAANAPSSQFSHVPKHFTASASVRRRTTSETRSFRTHHGPLNVWKWNTTLLRIFVLHSHVIGNPLQNLNPLDPFDSKNVISINFSVNFSLNFQSRGGRQREIEIVNHPSDRDLCKAL